MRFGMNKRRWHSQKSYRRCAFTGYRPQKMPFGYDENDPRCVSFKARLRETIESLIAEGYAHFLSGGALGMDQFAAEIVVELKEKYPWIVLEMVSPFDGQAAKWPIGSRLRLAELYDAADIVTSISHEYTKGCIFQRNRYLVENSDLLLAAYDGKPGGTAMTCDYAEEMGVPVRRIMPGEVS